MSNKNKNEVVATDNKTQNDSPVQYDYIEVIPVADIIESPEAVEVVLDMPGVIPDSIDVKVENNVLEVKAESQIKNGASALRYRRKFQVSEQIQVPDITAKTQNGVLTLFMPKSTKAMVHRVKVEHL